MSEIVQEGKNREEALKAALEKLGVEESNVDVEVLEGGGGGGLFGFLGSKPIKIKVTVKERNAVEEVRSFFDKIFGFLEIDSEFTASETEAEIRVDISGKESGILIGKFGQTLDSLQYLANVALSRKFPDVEQKKIVVDVEDYRRRREDSLSQMAKNMASKVLKTKKSVSLAPMPPHDRRIVHMALSDHAQIKTFSEGMGLNRKVVISYKDR